MVPELDVASLGDTPEEAAANLLEAATLHLEGAFEDGLPYLRPIPSEVDPRLAVPDAIERIFRFKVDVAVRTYAYAAPVVRANEVLSILKRAGFVELCQRAAICA